MNSSSKRPFAHRPPNFLIVMTDDERYPAAYETPGLRRFRQKYLRGHRAIRECGLTFHRHYAASLACCPSRTSLFTGHYPSLHGVTQTPGIAKTAFDKDMFWLDPNTVPTIGDYFRAAGYRTFYRGKWDISRANIYSPGPNPTVVSSLDEKNQPIPEIEALYEQAKRLEGYGFSSWIGSDPIEPELRDTGTLRDPIISAQVIYLLQELEIERQSGQTDPWLVVCSMVNPHDIGFYGLPWLQMEDKPVDPAVPNIPPPPTRAENLATKPRCQKDYVQVYRQAALLQPATEHFRRFYYTMIHRVDREINRVVQALRGTCFFEDTIVVYTSDHGTMLGAHGGMHQKWHNAYEETIHIPLTVANPRLFDKPKNAFRPTSHTDLLPTLLGLAGIDVEKTRKKLAADHTLARPLVGRNLAPAMLGLANPGPDEPILFVSDDEISEGSLNTNMRGETFSPVTQPNHVQTIVVRENQDGQENIWKYSRYWDNPEFSQSSEPQPSEYECYNLADDPFESRNLAHPEFATSENEKKLAQLQVVLDATLAEKCLKP